MVEVEHAGDSIEAESIKLVLLYPEAKVTQKEPQHLMAAVVEQPAIPLVVATFTTFMEVEVIRAIEHVDSIQHILRRMAVHHVKQDHQPHAVRSVN